MVRLALDDKQELRYRENWYSHGILAVPYQHFTIAVWPSLRLTIRTLFTRRIPHFTKVVFVPRLITSAVPGSKRMVIVFIVAWPNVKFLVSPRRSCTHLSMSHPSFLSSVNERRKERVSTNGVKEKQTIKNGDRVSHQQDFCYISSLCW